MSPDVEKALDEVLEKLRSMTDAEFRAKLDKHKDGDWAKIFQRIYEDLNETE